MKKIFAVILLALAFTTQSCKKDDDEPIIVEKPPVEVPCQYFDMNGCSLGGSWGTIGNQYYSPRFNPRNANEFLYVKEDTLGAWSIHKYNLQTKQNTLILANIPPISNPDWSRTGWIVFSDMNWKVWKVRDDGTGLQQISFGVDDQHPVFNPAGDKIIYCRDPHGDAKMLIIDINGNPVDSLCSVMFGQCYNWFYSSWSESDRILRLTATGQGTDGELSYYNYATKQDEAPLYIFKEEKNGQVFTDYKALSSTKVIYTMVRKGLLEFDASTQNHKVIKPYCDNWRYFYFDISPDKTRLVAEKEIQKQVQKCLVQKKSTIVVMNLDGSNEQTIELP